MTSTTGTSIEGYLDWLRKELAGHNYGEVAITFTISQGQVTYVKRHVMEGDQIPYQKHHGSA